MRDRSDGREYYVLQGIVFSVLFLSNILETIDAYGQWSITLAVERIAEWAIITLEKVL